MIAKVGKKQKKDDEKRENRTETEKKGGEKLTTPAKFLLVDFSVPALSGFNLILFH